MHVFCIGEGMVRFFDRLLIFSRSPAMHFQIYLTGYKNLEKIMTWKGQKIKKKNSVPNRDSNPTDIMVMSIPI